MDELINTTPPSMYCYAIHFLANDLHRPPTSDSAHKTRSEQTISLQFCEVVQREKLVLFPREMDKWSSKKKKTHIQVPHSNFQIYQPRRSVGRNLPSRHDGSENNLSGHNEHCKQALEKRRATTRSRHAQQQSSQQRKFPLRGRKK